MHVCEYRSILFHFLRKAKAGLFQNVKTRRTVVIGDKVVIIMVEYNLKAIIIVSLKRSLKQYLESPTPKVTSTNAKHAKINHINILKNSLF